MSQNRTFKSEREFTDWLKSRAAKKPRGLILGIGDDAALIEARAGWPLALTSDFSIEGIHFTERLHPPAAVGHRALARSLSDIAAMGATPRFALISLALSPRADRAWTKSLYEGIFRLARRFGVAVAGGDTAAGVRQTALDVTVAGEVAPGRALLRSGARRGDLIFVAGELGLSALGLRLLKKHNRSGSARHQKAIRAHLYPEPQCPLGSYLARRGLASAAIDISDGLSIDLARLAEASGLGASIEAGRIPVAQSQESPFGARSLLSLALGGGEDYKLLFTVPAARSHLLPRRFQGIRIYRIGEMRGARQGVTMVRDGKTVPLEPAGYDHFHRS